MIVCINEKIIIITPSKTGSCSLHDALCQQQNYIYVIGPRIINKQTNDYTIDRHSFVCENIFLKHVTGNFRTVCITRNPFDRLKSLYKHWIFHKNFTGVIENFYRECINVAHQDSFLSNIATLCAKTNCNIDEFWKIENIEMHLNENNITFDSINKRNVLNIDEIDKINNDNLNFAMDWIEPDLIKFDY
jgi:hypothetical protein